MWGVRGRGKLTSRFLSFFAAVGLLVPRSNSGMQHRGRNNGYRDWKSIQNTVERNVRYWPLADIPLAPARCPLSGVKQTSRLMARMSAYDPKRTCEPLLDHLVGVPGITAATPSGLMLKAKNVRGVSLGFPH